jgi:hypothetical protein
MGEDQCHPSRMATEDAAQTTFKQQSSEGHLHALAILRCDLQPIRAPACVAGRHRHFALVPARLCFAPMMLEEAMRCRSVEPLRVPCGLSLLLGLSAQDCVCPRPTVLVRLWPFIQPDEITRPYTKGLWV